MAAKRKPSARKALEREFRVKNPSVPLDSSQVEDRRGTGNKYKPMDPTWSPDNLERAIPSTEILPAAGKVQLAVTRIARKDRPLPRGLTRPVPGDFGGHRKSRKRGK